MPSPTLSQLPSGVYSLVSPSAADAASVGGDVDGEDAEEPLATAAAELQLRVAGGDIELGRATDGAAGPATGAGAAEVTVGQEVKAVSTDGNGSAAAGAAAGGAAAVGGAGGGAKVAGVMQRLLKGLAVAVPRPAPAAAANGAGAAGDSRDGDDGSPRSTLSGVSKGGSLWQRAVNLSKAAADPWASRQLHALHMERAVRQRYNAHTGQWVTDEVLVKMEAKPFAAGAMRECYAAKKLSTFTHNVDWHKAQNMVAKRYKKEGVRRSVYYNDVLVQMDAKMLGEMYNRTDPPKQVDVMQCAILQFAGRPGAPVYAVEQLIEGDYVKYNSNSGFVKGDDLLRNTPQAFSHFTWTLTKGLKICVDIQGVGDLYTDPQLHTLDGEGYGEGNLGLRGMALFFRSHECNALCARLGLPAFDRCDADVRSQGYSSQPSSASASATRPGGATAARTWARTSSYKARMARRQAAAPAAWPTEEAALAALADVPKESPVSLVHLEVAKLYGEVVLLPELRPSEDPEDALRGGLFHLCSAASCGCLMALTMLARAHLGLEPSAPQFAHIIKVATKQRCFSASAAVGWRCTLLAAERGVRGAALAAAAAYGGGGAGGGNAFFEGPLGGKPDPAQAARWYAAALELPDLLAEGEGGEGSGGEGAGAGRGTGGVIHEGDEEAEADEEEDDDSGRGGRGGNEEEDDDAPQFDMSVMRDPQATAGPEGRAAHDAQHVSGLSDLHLSDLASPRAAPGTAPGGLLAGLRVPKLEELRPSRAFLARLKRSVEEEAAVLPGASAARYEILYAYGSVLLAGGPGLPPNPAKAAELLEEAAEEAGGAGKGRLAQKYYELAAQAQAAAEEAETEAEAEEAAVEETS
ncbi:hypothetical protein GPECTOR_11g114 [Gonium pectorale]|uniref:Alpha-type protein kinase domain-containing protein n=1 Tax=Gonium pectorale TaxID=33097 RepID=A0A150GPC8_GONPE|nr:hypothetical protein GPECTOR_11g114 [Gonium pectorale]|eukprot:KXZ51661.1 hypothetical protein GPECTOR_11g114 [Gonium pectorale]